MVLELARDDRKAIRFWLDRGKMPVEGQKPDSRVSRLHLFYLFDRGSGRPPSVIPHPIEHGPCFLVRLVLGEITLRFFDLGFQASLGPVVGAEDLDGRDLCPVGSLPEEERRPEVRFLVRSGPHEKIDGQPLTVQNLRERPGMAEGVGVEPAPRGNSARRFVLIPTRY